MVWNHQKDFDSIHWPLGLSLASSEAPDEEVVREAAADNAARALGLGLAARTAGVVCLLLLLARELVWVLLGPDRAEQAFFAAPLASLRPSWVPTVLGVERLKLAPLAPEVVAVETRDCGDEVAELHHTLVLLVDLVGEARGEVLTVEDAGDDGLVVELLAVFDWELLVKAQGGDGLFVRVCGDEEEKDEGKAAPPLNQLSLCEFWLTVPACRRAAALRAVEEEVGGRIGGTSSFPTFIVDVAKEHHELIVSLTWQHGHFGRPSSSTKLVLSCSQLFRLVVTKDGGEVDEAVGLNRLGHSRKKQSKSVAGLDTVQVTFHCG